MTSISLIARNVLTRKTSRRERNGCFADVYAFVLVAPNPVELEPQVSAGVPPTQIYLPEESLTCQIIVANNSHHAQRLHPSLHRVEGGLIPLVSENDIAMNTRIEIRNAIWDRGASE